MLLKRKEFERAEFFGNTLTADSICFGAAGLKSASHAVARSLREHKELILRAMRSLREHKELILNWFKARSSISFGATEGLNNKEKVACKKILGL